MSACVIFDTLLYFIFNTIHVYILNLINTYCSFTLHQHFVQSQVIKLVVMASIATGVDGKSNSLMNRN